MPVVYILVFVWPFVAPNMATTIIGQLILVVFAAEGSRDNYGRTSHLGWLIGGLIPYGIVLLILEGTYPQISTPHIETKTIRTETIPLVSLTAEVGVHGSFSLGYGTVDSTPIYMSKKRTKDGGYENFIISGQTTVYEDVLDKKQATLQKFQTFVRETRRNVPTWARYVAKEKKVESW